MGIDYSVGVGVGYEVPLSVIAAKYAKDVEEKSHKEKRFDPSSGKRLKDVEVVDREAGRVFFIMGQEIESEDPHGLAEALSEEFSATVSFVCDSMDAFDDDHPTLMIGPSYSFPDTDGSCSIGNISTDKPLTLKGVIDAWPAVVALGEHLRSVGIEPGEPVVRVIGGYG